MRPLASKTLRFGQPRRGVGLPVHECSRNGKDRASRGPRNPNIQRALRLRAQREHASQGQEDQTSGLRSGIAQGANCREEEVGVGVFIHEQLDVDGGGRGKLIELIRNRWAPHMEREHGVRLVGAWATVGSTAAWPEVRLQWEMANWEAFARAQTGQHPCEEQDVFLSELCSPDHDFEHVGVLANGVVLVENVTAKAGQLGHYHEALASRFAPLAGARGMRLIGLYENAVHPNCGMNLWSFPGWDEWRDYLAGEDGDSERRDWTDGLRTWLAELDGFLVVSPPKGILRT
jgi:hypothetical protein